MQTLPTFIFADENHLSPLLSNVLSKLAPGLKKIGYDNFYYESSSKLSREQTISFLEDQQKLIEAGNTILPAIKLEMLDYMSKNEYLWSIEMDYYLLRAHFSLKAERQDDTLYLFYLASAIGLLERCASEIGKDKMSRAVVTEVIDRYIESLNSSLTSESIICLLKAINDNQINYKGIDDSSLRGDQICCQTASDCFNVMKSIIDMSTDANIEKRNKTMAYEYLQANAPVFGFTGLGHVTGMQKLLASMIPAEIAMANFNFIYIYREALDESAIPQVNKMREDLRTNKLPLPLGLILVDGIDKSEDQIVEEVMVRISEKIAAFKELPEKLKQIPDISLTGQLRAKMTGLYGLFSTAGNSIISTVSGAFGKDNENNMPGLH